MGRDLTFVEEPADMMDLAAWRAHRDRVRRLVEEDRLRERAAERSEAGEGR